MGIKNGMRDGVTGGNMYVIGYVIRYVIGYERCMQVRTVLGDSSDGCLSEGYGMVNVLTDGNGRTGRRTLAGE